MQNLSEIANIPELIKDKISAFDDKNRKGDTDTLNSFTELVQLASHKCQDWFLQHLEIFVTKGKTLSGAYSSAKQNASFNGTLNLLNKIQQTEKKINAALNEHLEKLMTCHNSANLIDQYKKLNQLWWDSVRKVLCSFGLVGAITIAGVYRLYLHMIEKSVSAYQLGLLHGSTISSGPTCPVDSIPVMSWQEAKIQTPLVAQNSFWSPMFWGVTVVLGGTLLYKGYQLYQTGRAWMQDYTTKINALGKYDKEIKDNLTQLKKLLEEIQTIKIETDTGADVSVAGTNASISSAMSNN